MTGGLGHALLHPGVYVSVPLYLTCSVSVKFESTKVPGTANPTWCEGTGTLPDYLVNRVMTKNEGSHPKKIVRKSRNSFSSEQWGCGSTRTV